jgi:hypothetical protein
VALGIFSAVEIYVVCLIQILSPTTILTVKQAEGLDCDPEQGDLIGRIFA